VTTVSRRFSSTLVLAFALHAGAIALVRAVRLPPPSAPREGEEAIAVELEESREPEVVPSVASPASAEGASSPPGAVAHAPTHAPVIASSGATTRDSEAPAATSPSSSPVVEAPPSDWSAWSLATRPDLEIGGSAIRERIARAAPPEESRPKSVGGLREELGAHDHALGLGAGGPIVGVAKDATSSSTAPVNGYALFEATFDTAGKIADVRLLDASADARSWEDVASAIKTAMHDRPVRIPADAKGLAVSVRVDSRWQLPDGSDPDPPKVCVPPFPCNAAPHRRKIVITPLGFSGFIPGFDDKPLRVVHARIVSERAL
jgi:hypothetical protein